MEELQKLVSIADDVDALHSSLENSENPTDSALAEELQQASIILENLINFYEENAFDQDKLDSDYTRKKEKIIDRLKGI